MSDAPDRPEFGPSGYLPPRAASRARKIVLRSPLGLQWVVGSLLVGVVVVVAGVLWLTGEDAPDEPWVPVGPVAEVESGTRDASLGVLLVANGRVRAFSEQGTDDLRYCPETRQLEDAQGGVWTLTGRGTGGRDSLEEHPTTLHDGVLYVDPSRTATGPPPADDARTPGCVD